MTLTTKFDTWGIAFNEDNNHFFATRADQSPGIAEIENFIDQYANTSVREIFLNPNAMRTSYDSHVWESLWSGYNPNMGENQPLFSSLSESSRNLKEWKWVHTAWALYSQGLDIYRIWIDRCRHNGITPWISIRMNDIHNVNDENNYQHSSFWKNNPQFRRVTNRAGVWLEKALDYGHSQTRSYVLSLIQEICNRYDMDGIELDWMRSHCNFKPGWELEGQTILNEFMNEIRAIIDKKSSQCGRRIKLAVRVPSSPQVAWDLGLDVFTWIRMNWIDMLTVSPRFETLDTDMPIELWRNIIDGRNIILAAALEKLLRPFPEANMQNNTNTLETLRGAAISYWGRGIDRLYLFNYMDCLDKWSAPHNLSDNYTKDYQKILDELGRPATLQDKKRRYVLTFSDTSAIGNSIAATLPKKCFFPNHNWVTSFKLHIGPKPIGGKASIILGFESAIQVAPGFVSVWLNESECYQDVESRLMLNPGPTNFAVFNTDIISFKSGYNVVDVIALKSEVVITWVEIQWSP